MLRLDADQFHLEMEKALAEVDRLDGRNANVDVKVDAAQAAAELESVAVAADRVDRENVKVGTSSRNAGQGLGILGTSIIALGPALVPLAAGATGLAVGFTAMGAAGILAIVGVKREMEAGSAVGATYGRELGTLNQNLTDLSRTAATNVLGSFQTAVADLQSKMPALNSIIGEFSTVTGRTAAALTSGLVAGFIALEPLMRDAAGYVLNLSQRFQAMMSGGGITSFGDYVRSVFPQVMATLENIVETAGRLVAAFAPLGGGVLSMLNTFATAINAIPLPVLTALATVGPAIFLGFQAAGAVTAGVQAFATALTGLGVAGERAAVGVRTLEAAAGPIGLAVAALSVAFTMFSENSRNAEQASNDFADALRASNGVIDESIAKKAAAKLQDQGALDVGRELGVNLRDVTLAALQDADAQARLATQLAASKEAAVQSAQGSVNGAEAMAAWQDKANALTGAVGMTSTALQTGAEKYRNLAAATAETTPTVDAASAALTKAGRAAEDLARQAANLQTTLGPQAALYGTTATALGAYYDGQRKATDATADATLKMFQENNAAGILKGTLDALNGKALSAADAQNRFESALVNLSAPVDAAGKKVKFAADALDGMSSASVTLRGQLNGQIRSVEGVAEANGGLANSTGKAREQLMTMRQQIIDTAVANGVGREAVTKYVDGLLKIPKEIPPTKLDVDKAAAQKKIDETNAELKALGLQRPVPVVGADIGQATAKMNSAKVQLMDLDRTRPIPVVDANTAQALGKIASAKVGLMDLDRTRPVPVVDTNISAALGKIGSAKVALMDLDRTNPTPTVTANTGSAMADIRAVQYALGALTDRSITIRTTTIATRMDAAAPVADGAIFKAFAGGGFENHVAQIAPAGAMRLWAEPETGGEAYIPLAPSKRARSTEIWEETGRLLGKGGRCGCEGIDYQRLAAAMSRVVLRPTISAGSVDLAMGTAVH